MLRGVGDVLRLSVTITSSPVTLYVTGPIVPEGAASVCEAVGSALGTPLSRTELQLVHKPTPHWRMTYKEEALCADETEKVARLISKLEAVLWAKLAGRWRQCEELAAAGGATPEPPSAWPAAGLSSGPSGLFGAQGGGAAAGAAKAPPHKLPPALSCEAEKAGEATALLSLGALRETTFFRQLTFRRLRESIPKISSASDIVSHASVGALNSSGRGVPSETKELYTMLRAIEGGRIHVNAADSEGRTALHLACLTAHFLPQEPAKENIIFLLEMGGNPMLCDAAGVRPVDIAEAQSVPDEDNIPLGVMRRFVVGAKAKIEATRLPRHIAEIQVEGVGSLAFSEVVSLMVYYESTLTGALCCRHLESRKSYVLHVGSSASQATAQRQRQQARRQAPQGFVVLPYSRALHSGHVCDYLLLHNGTLLVVDQRTVDPAVTAYATPLRFSTAHHGTALASVVWTPDAADEAQERKCRLHPSYLEALGQEIASLEAAGAGGGHRAGSPPASASPGQKAEKRELAHLSRGRDDANPSVLFTRNMLLYPHAGQHAGQAAATADAEDDDANEFDDDVLNDALFDDPESDEHSTANTGVASGLANTQVLHQQSEPCAGSCKRRSECMGVLALATTDASGGPSRLATLHLPWFRAGTSKDIGQGLCDSITTAWGEVPFVKRRENPDGVVPIAADFALPAEARVGSITCQAQVGKVVFGMDNGSYVVYCCSSLSFTLFKRGDTRVRHGVGYTISDDTPQLNDGLDIECGATTQGLPHPLHVPTPSAPPPPIDAPLTNSICVAATMNNLGYYALFSSQVEVFQLGASHTGDVESGDKLASSVSRTPPKAEFIISQGDEVSTGCFHPKDADTLIFTRNSLLCYYSVKTRQIGVLGVLKLTEYELSRKAADDDLTGCKSDTIVNGTHVLTFSPDGLLLYRLNTLYQCAAIYEWSDFKDMVAKEKSAVYVQKSLMDVRGISMNRHWVSQRVAKAYLRRERSIGMPVEHLKTHLASLCSAIYKRRVPPALRDADGRTALHIAMELANSNEYVLSSQAKAIVVWLLRRGANFYACDHTASVTRAYDIGSGLLDQGASGSGGGGASDAACADEGLKALQDSIQRASIFVMERRSPDASMMGSSLFLESGGDAPASGREQKSPLLSNPLGAVPHVTVAADAVLQYRRYQELRAESDRGITVDYENSPLVVQGLRAPTVSFSERDREHVVPIAELGEDCEQVACSASHEGMMYFISSVRGALLAVNVEKQFTAEIYSFPGVARMCVFPYSDTLHEARDKDYILVSNGCVLRVHFRHGPAARPTVDEVETELRCDLQGGMQGLLFAASAVHIDPNEAASADYSMGVVSTVHLSHSAGVRAHVTLHLSSLLFPGDKSVKSVLEFLRDAINMAWCSEGPYNIRNVLSEGTLVSHVTAVNHCCEPSGYVAVCYENPCILPPDEVVPVVLPSGATVEQSEPSEQPQCVIGYIQDGSGKRQFLISPRCQSEGVTVSASLAYSKDRKQLVATRYSRSLELFRISTAAFGGAGTAPSVDVSGCDPLAENTDGAFHPLQSSMLLFVREGVLGLLDTETEEVRCVAELRLSDVELQRKGTEGDGTDDARVTGHQTLSLSSNGVYAVRYNSFYRSFVVYSYADVMTRLRIIGDDANLALLPSALDPSAALTRPPRKMELKGALKRMTTKGLSLRETKAALLTFMSAMSAGLITPNFSDREGKTAMHLLLDIADQIGTEEAIQHSTFLLAQGLNVFTTDEDFRRPIDALAGGTSREVLLKSIVRLRDLIERNAAELKSAPPSLDVASVPAHTPNLIVRQVQSSATAASAYYALCSQARHREPFETGSRTPALWCLYYIEVHSDAHEVVAQGSGDLDSVGWHVLPYCQAVHGQSNIDFLIVGSTLYTVRRLPRCAVNSMELDSTVVSVHSADSFSCVWGAAAPASSDTASGGDGRDSTAAQADMIGSLCFYSAARQCIKVVRIPNIEHDDTSKAKFLSFLLRLSSPVEIPLDDSFVTESGTPGGQQAAESLCVQVKGTRSDGSGVFLVSNGFSILALDLRGRRLEVISAASTLPCRFTLSVASYADGVFVSVHRPAGVTFYSLAHTADSVAFNTHCRVHDPSSDSLDLSAFAFHPTEPLAVGVVDNEVVVYDCVVRVLSSVYRLTMSELEVSQREQDGDGASPDVVGTQHLLFCATASDATPEGRDRGHCLVRVNAFYCTATAYEERGVRSTYENSVVDGVRTLNAFHLNSLCSKQKRGAGIHIASPVQPKRLGNIARKEALRGGMGRVRTSRESYDEQRSALSKMVRMMRGGAIAPSFADADGSTPLHILFRLAHTLPEQEVVGLIKYLLAVGASLYVCDKQGRRPSDLLRPRHPNSEVALATLLTCHLEYNEPLLPPPRVEFALSASQAAASRVRDNVCYAAAQERGSTRVCLVKVRAGESESELAAIRDAQERFDRGCKATSAPATPDIEGLKSMGADLASWDGLGSPCVAPPESFHDHSLRNGMHAQVHASANYALATVVLQTHVLYQGGSVDVLLTSSGTLLHVQNGEENVVRTEAETNEEREARAEGEGFLRRVPLSEASIESLSFVKVACGYVGPMETVLAVVDAQNILCVYCLPTDKVAAVRDEDDFANVTTAQLYFDISPTPAGAAPPVAGGGGTTSPSLCRGFPSVDALLEARQEGEFVFGTKAEGSQSAARRRLTEALEGGARSGRGGGAGGGGGGGGTEEQPPLSAEEQEELCNAVSGALARRGELLVLHLKDGRTLFWKRKAPTTGLMARNERPPRDVVDQVLIRSKGKALLQALAGSSLAVYDLSFLEKGDTALLRGNTTLRMQPLFLLDDSEGACATGGAGAGSEEPAVALPITGCIHPTQRQLFVFVKETCLCALELDTLIVRIIGEVQVGPVEEAAGASGLQVDALKRVFFTAKGRHLVILNQYHGILAVHGWKAMQALLDDQFARPAISSTAVFLPVRVADYDLRLLYENLAATLSSVKT